MTCSKTACCMHPPSDTDADYLLFKLNPRAQTILLLSGAAFGIWCREKLSTYPLPAQIAMHCSRHHGARSFCKSADSGRQLDPAVVHSLATPPKGWQGHPVFSSRAGHSSAGRTEQLYRRKWGKTLLICRISWQEFACWRLQLGRHSLRLTLWGAGFSWNTFSTITPQLQ